MSSRMRVTKGHTGNRRSHHALKEVRTSICPNCNANHERHKVCLECGFYKGRQVLNIKTKKEKLEKTPEEVPNTSENKKTEIQKKDANIISNTSPKKIMKKVQNKG